MILESSEHLHGFTAVTLEHGIVNDEGGNPVRGRERVYLIQRGDAKRGQKATPCKASMIENDKRRPCRETTRLCCSRAGETSSFDETEARRRSGTAESN